MEPLFSWIFESRFERGKQWYMIAATLAITSIIVSFLIGSFLFGIVIILFVGVYLLYDVNSHPTVRVLVTWEGIMVDRDKYVYNRIQSFAIIRMDSRPIILRLRITSRTIGTIDLLLDPALDVPALHDYLLGVLSEDPTTELTFMEHLLLRLRL